MKKKIKDLTLNECKKFCENYDKEGCKKCPLYNIVCADFEIYYTRMCIDDDLEREIEIDEA